MTTLTFDNWASDSQSAPVVTDDDLTTFDNWVSDSQSSPLVGDFGGAALTLDDDSFQNASPFDQDESIGTVVATGGTPPYTYEILSQVLS